MFPCRLVVPLDTPSGISASSLSANNSDLTNTASKRVVHAKLLKMPFDRLQKPHTPSMAQEHVYVTTSELSSKDLVVPTDAKKI